MTTTAVPVGAFARTARFLRHLVEMTVAMMVGMLIYGAAVGAAVGLGGGSYESVRVGRPALFALGMAASMSVTMVAWMRLRGHDWRLGGEMTAAMFAPAVVLIVCERFDLVAAGAVCPLACAAMVPAMAIAMLARLDVYAGPAQLTG